MTLSTSEHPTRERILRAAEILFAEHGYAGVSMRNIASTAGVNLGGLPYHFGTKEALYRAIWQFWIGQTEANAMLQEAAAQSATSTASKLRSLVSAFYEGPGRLLRDPRGKHFVAILVREANDPASAERGLLEEFIFPSGAVFRKEFQRLLPETPGDMMDVAFEMMISGLRIVIERRPPAAMGPLELQEADRLFAHVTDFVVHGWLAFDAASNRGGALERHPAQSA